MSLITTDQWTTASGTAHINSTRPRFAVTFTGNGNPLQKVSFKLRLYTAGTPANVQAEIYSISGSNLPATLLATSTPISSSTIPNGALTWIDFVFDGTFTPVNGTKYFVAIARPSGDPVIELNVGNANGYILVRMEGSNWMYHDVGVDLATNFIVYTSSGGNSGGGGCNCDWNGNEIDQPITVRSAYLKLYNYQSDANSQPDQGLWSWSVRDWLYGGDKIGGVATQYPPGADVLKNIGIRLFNNKPSTPEGSWWNNLHNIVILSNSDPEEKGSPALGVTKHFFVRGDFIVRGPLNSHEGIITLHGNGVNRIGSTNYPATPGDFKTGWNIGWGPREGGAPFILLAEGGDYNLINKQGGNEAASTLLIVTNNEPTIHDPPLGLPGYSLGYPNSGAYKWGHLEAGNITAHGTLYAENLHADNITGIQKGHIAIPSNHPTDYIDVTFTTPFPTGYNPVVICTPIDGGGRSISITITNLPGQPTNNFRTGFRAYASIAIVTGQHNHKFGTVGTRQNGAVASIAIPYHRSVELDGIGHILDSADNQQN
ncbi:MAG: hypothetical protein FWH37_08755, partial [Candidatus Bathyarchaeota archaeon]|nr:hypothetical protein [Candidatus Termiticorpusculum sp.]